MTGTPIRVGIIGAHPERGWAATAHLPGLKQLPQFRVTTVSHHSLETAQEAAAKFGIPNAVATTPELVNRSDVALVVITVKVTRRTTAVGVSGKVLSRSLERP
jgi:predicted dehydrogenase